MMTYLGHLKCPKLKNLDLETRHSTLGITLLERLVHFDCHFLFSMIWLRCHALDTLSGLEPRKIPALGGLGRTLKFFKTIIKVNTLIKINNNSNK